MNGAPEVVKVQVVRLFESYARTDAAWRDRLEPVLKVEIGVALGQRFHDQQLTAGEGWDIAIRRELEKMHLFVPLVSYAFLASDYIRDVELPTAKTRHEQHEIEVVPILLEQLDLERLNPFLFHCNPLPAFGKCWLEYSPRNRANHLIGNGLKDAIRRVRAGV